MVAAGELDREGARPEPLELRGPHPPVIEIDAQPAGCR